ncbi:helix-turn-helix transcriptional regulator [Nitrosospira multiformis]|uniref:helix-turn-helix transcriptional regulator n=1 Tax=Nitrosospira multiformis TaxID=1231 RepID=UPI0009BE07FB
MPPSASHRARWNHIGGNVQIVVKPILKQPEVSRVTGLSRSSIYRLEAQGQFPSRVKLSECASGWHSEEVQAWIDSRPRVTPKAGA